MASVEQLDLPVWMILYLHTITYAPLQIIWTGLTPARPVQALHTDPSSIVRSYVCDVCVNVTIHLQSVNALIDPVQSS